MHNTGKAFSYHHAATVSLSVLVMIFLAACGGSDTTALSPVTPTDDTAAVAPDLMAVLQAELYARGTGLDRATSLAPNGEANEVFDLTAGTTELEEGYEIQLNWTELCSGDYNLDGMVTVNDLTPLAVYWQSLVSYDDPADHEGFAWWPSGTNGDLNWRIAAVDGNRDGEVNVSDVTPIGQHWQERLSGFRVYRRQPGQEAFELLPNPNNPEDVLTVPRTDALAAIGATAGLDRPLPYSFIDGAQKGESWSYYVRAYDPLANSLGPRSNIVVVNIPGNEPPSVILTAEPFSGNAPLNVSFDASTSGDPDGHIIIYEWDFDGDGTFDSSTGTTPSTSHTYSVPGQYQATVSAMDNDGGVGYDSIVINVINQTPQADLTADMTSCTRLDTVTFDASGSTDADGTIVEYAWDFDGDGTYDAYTTENTTTYSYEDTGNHQARVCVTDSSGDTDTAFIMIWVANVLPEVSVYVQPESPQAGSLVTFNFSNSYDPDGEIVTYRLKYGLHTTSGSSPAISVTFDSAGSYVMEYAVRDDSGDWATIDGQLEVFGVQQDVIGLHGYGGRYPSLDFADDYPAMCYYNSDSPTYPKLVFRRAIDLAGSDWGAPTTILSAGSGSENFCSFKLLSNNLPAVCFLGPNVAGYANLYYSHGLNAMGTSWSTPLQIASGIKVARISLTELDGAPAVVAINNSDYLVVCRAADASGTAWSSALELDTLGTVEAYSNSLVFADEIGLVYTTLADRDLLFLRIAFGATVEPGTPVAVDGQTDVTLSHNCLLHCAGTPWNFVRVAFIDGDGNLRIAASLDEAGNGFVSGIPVVSGVTDLLSFAEVNGALALLYETYAVGYKLNYLHLLGGGETPVVREIHNATVPYYDRASNLIDNGGLASLAFWDDEQNYLGLWTMIE
ncbi:PKD domain-containing protein [bacterium]|nr:PKD domain-containing protein [bacterium]